ncbi:hypothetical protein [Nguyenibacter vanlangensis]|uniref:Uncharacterized protein n=1 Tax=Nguyenibacter vanlangensis TaxID=1216886 RepID=A0A7Y7IVA2_9PROT|nr:hypothetical protein [Nguyenibacter vanlangensis]NVN10952.1 hypothetical protein [Nguyenibacter vanlangensis]
MDAGRHASHVGISFSMWEASMLIHQKPVPAEATELVRQHGSEAILLAKTHLIEAEEIGDDEHVAYWKNVLEAMQTILNERKPH